MTTNAHQDQTPSIEEARERYRIEREKRLRTDGLAQFKEFKGEYAAFDRDPYVEPGFTRDPVVETTDVVIVGGGYGGMLTAVNLLRRGITNFRIIEKAGDFGGTWYWNRYPGCMCDVESYTYMPLLEETGYMPTMKYASASEIFDVLVPRYLETQIYNLLLESLTSEYASRRFAMKNATDAATDMQAVLKGIYNRKRQEGITTELLDIVGGAAAIGN